MKQLFIEHEPNGRRIISGVSDIFQDCSLTVHAGDRVWHCENRGAEATFRVVIDQPGDVSIWRGKECIFAPPEPEQEESVNEGPQPTPEDDQPLEEAVEEAAAEEPATADDGEAAVEEATETTNEEPV